MHVKHNIMIFLINIQYSSDVTLRSQAVYSQVRVYNSYTCYCAIDEQCLQVNQGSISIITILANQHLSMVLCILS